MSKSGTDNCVHVDINEAKDMSIMQNLCVRENPGTLYIVTQHSSCAIFETAIALNAITDLMYYIK